MVLRTVLLGMGLSAGLTACGQVDDSATPEAPLAAAAALAPAPPESTAEGAVATTEARTVLVMGDSLSAAYNLAAEQGWVALLDTRLRTEAPGFRMVNA